MQNARVMFGVIVGVALARAWPCDAGPVETCRQLVDRVGVALVKGVSESEEKCLAARAAGRLPTGTKCIGFGGTTGSITDAATRSRIQRLAAKADALLARGCDDRSLLLAPPQGLGLNVACSALLGQCDGVADSGNGARACLLCTHLSAAHYLLSVRYPGEAPGGACATFSVEVSVAVVPHPSTGSALGGVDVQLSYPPPLSLPGSGADDTVLRQIQILPLSGGLRLVNDRDTNTDGIDDQVIVSYITLEPFEPGPFARITFCEGAGSVPDVSALTCVASAATPNGDELEASCSVAVAP